MFAMFICLFLCIMCAAYVQMGANLCKCMLCYTSSFPAKVVICCRRLLGCYLLPGCVEEELSGT